MASIDFAESISLTQIMASEGDKNLNKLRSSNSSSRMRKLMVWETYQLHVPFLSASEHPTVDADCAFCVVCGIALNGFRIASARNRIRGLSA